MVVRDLSVYIGGYKAPGGGRSANFTRRALAEEKGGKHILAAAACQFAAFSSKLFQTGRSAFCLRKIDRDALSRGGRIQWWRERMQLNLGTISDGKKLFCGGTEQQIFPSPNEGAQRGRKCILHVSVVGTRRSKSKG